MAFAVLLVFAVALALRALVWAGVAWFVLLFADAGFWPAFGIVAAVDIIVASLLRGVRK